MYKVMGKHKICHLAIAGEVVIRIFGGWYSQIRFSSILSLFVLYMINTRLHSEVAWDANTIEIDPNTQRGG